MNKIVLLSQEHRKTMLYILKRTWFSGAGSGFEPNKLHKLKFLKNKKKCFTFVEFKWNVKKILKFLYNSF